MRKDYPVYGRTIATHIVRGEKPMAVGVLLSARWWSSFDHVARVCIKPEDWAPGRYEFGYLQGLHVVAVAGDCDEKPFGELVLDLMLARPSLLWAFDITGRELVGESAPDPRGLAQWAAEMAGLTPAVALRDPRVRLAEAFYWDGIVKAGAREVEEMNKIEQRKDLEAAVRWVAARHGYVDRVREQFSLRSLQEPSAPQPA